MLNIATFGTEGTRSALLSAARGMGIDVDEVGYLTSLIPVERGFSWSLSDCFYGDQEKGRKPVTELINALSEYKGLMEIALKIEGVIKSRSVHASGIYIFSDDYFVRNAMMQSSSGIPTTQFDMADSDALGSLKIDALTVQGLDRIRTCMDLLVQHGYLENKGSLRATYDAYLHPDKLVYDDKTMWDKVAANQIPDLFQFDTPVGLQCARKAKPQSVEELSAANSLMRLMSDGEQPIDKFVRHKEDVDQWIAEMDSYQLTQDEQAVMKKHLGTLHGVADSQEAVMLMLMDEEIAGFSIADANFARKVIGKKLMDKIPQVKQMMFGKENALGQ